MLAGAVLKVELYTVHPAPALRYIHSTLGRKQGGKRAYEAGKTGSERRATQVRAWGRIPMKRASGRGAVRVRCSAPV